MNKVVIVGCGNVGMSYAYNIVTTKNAITELVLIDVRVEKAEGEALDLLHAAAYSNPNIKIKAGNYKDCNDADIVCICAGRNQEPGETRQDLIDKNLGVFKSIIGEINKTKFNGIYLVATNPLDTMTYVTKTLAGFNPNKVIGSGTTLDTSRLRYLIGQELDINPKNVHGYVIGKPISCGQIAIEANQVPSPTNSIPFANGNSFVVASTDAIPREPALIAKSLIFPT